MTDVAAVIVAGACAIGFLLMALAATHPRRHPVRPVSRRGMRRYVESPPGDYDDPDGTR
jgi:hypothetical protein